MSFEKQLEAIGSALLLVPKLPSGTTWALTCTNDDDAESPTVFNIYAPEDTWSNLQSVLHLGKPTDRSTHEGEDQFISFRRGTLLVSFIQQEES
jgi:hypothetical protein